MNLERVKTLSAQLSPWAHLATVGRDGDPDVVPIHPAWEGDVLWFMTGAKSVKVRNIAHHPNVALHWQVTEAGDGLEVWGRATAHADLDTKRRLWKGVFDYDLDQFAPGGADGSPEVAFVAIRPVRAVYIKAFGTKGREHWGGLTGRHVKVSDSTFVSPRAKRSRASGSASTVVARPSRG